MYKLARDSYYIEIDVTIMKDGKSRLEIFPFYINENGIKQRNFTSKYFYIESDSIERTQICMENIIDYLYIESQNDDIYRYSKLKFNHKSIMLLLAHSTLIGCHSSIVELLSVFMNNKIIDKSELQEAEI